LIRPDWCQGYTNTFWAKSRTINDLKKCLANSDVIISLWVGNEIVGFGRALSDGVYRGVLWDIVIDQNHQGKGFGTLIVKNLLSSKKIKNTKKLYLMTTNKKLFYSQFDFKEVTSQNLLIRQLKWALFLKKTKSRYEFTIKPSYKRS